MISGSSFVLLLDLSSLLDLGDGSLCGVFVLRATTCRLLFMLQLPMEEGV